MAEIPLVAPGQLAATCLFDLEQEIHFSTIYTADLRNKLVMAPAAFPQCPARIWVLSLGPGQRRSGGEAVDKRLPGSSGQKGLRLHITLRGIQPGPTGASPVPYLFMSRRISSTCMEDLRPSQAPGTFIWRR